MEYSVRLVENQLRGEFKELIANPDENPDLNKDSSHDPTTLDLCVYCDINTGKDKNLENITESQNHEDFLSLEIIDARPTIESCTYEVQEYGRHGEAWSIPLNS
jgi:hypothetical protein